VLVGVGEDAEQISAGYAQKIDLLLTDIVMPVVDGVELARRLSIQRPDMRVLYMSGYTDNMVVHRGVLAGSAAFLQKPFTATTLAEKIRSVLDDKRNDPAK
jgi:two-component system cell cycle sensor histidine kinase/response regulator CckA